MERRGNIAHDEWRWAQAELDRYEMSVEAIFERARNELRSRSGFSHFAEVMDMLDEACAYPTEDLARDDKIEAQMSTLEAASGYMHEMAETYVRLDMIDEAIALYRKSVFRHNEYAPSSDQSQAMSLAIEAVVKSDKPSEQKLNWFFDLAGDYFAGTDDREKLKDFAKLCIEPNTRHSQEAKVVLAKKGRWDLAEMRGLMSACFYNAYDDIVKDPIRPSFLSKRGSVFDNDALA